MPLSPGPLPRCWSAGPREDLVQTAEHVVTELDLRLSKRIRIDKVRLQIDGDFYNVFNSDWPFTVTSTFSTAATSAWLRPTNVLQARFFKLGVHFTF